MLYKIDKNGFLMFGEEINKTELIEIPEGYINIPLPSDNEGQLSFYRPRWNGSEWVEDMTQKEIDELNNQPKELAEIEKQQEIINTLGQELAQLKLQFMMGGM